MRRGLRGGRERLASQSIARSALGVNEAVRRAVELFAEGADEGIEGALGDDEGSPDRLHELAPGDDVAVMQAKLAQQEILAAREVNFGMVPHEIATLEIEDEVPEDDLTGSCDARATAGRTDAGDELGEGEGLGYIVVRASFQAGDDLIEIALRGEHENGWGVGPLPKTLSDGVAATVRKADVEDDDVELVLLAELLAFLGGEGGDDGVAALPESASQQIDHARVVLHDQNAQAEICVDEINPFVLNAAVTTEAIGRTLRHVE
jgi:hypothetical protein